MALQSSGQIKFSEIAAEFGDSAPHQMSEFVRGGVLVPQADANNNIPTSTSNMRFQNFYGAVNIIALTASNATNLNLLTFFGSAWADGVPKQLIIPSGVVIGSGSTGTAALIIPTGMGGSLEILNSGSIQGAGGSANSGTGGDAILAQSSGITINNQGTIYSGGGGGGQGGAGGNGQYQSGFNATGGCGWVSGSCSSNAASDATCNCRGETAYCVACEADPEVGGVYQCNQCRTPTFTSTTGGAGGAGGVGQGYNQSAASGSTGSSGGTNAGTGGTGGTGGSFGSSGANGATGANGNVTSGSAGSSGGLAGYYLNGIGNVTFSVTGTVAGRTV